MSNRIVYFDLAKGLCIILVVLFHFQEHYGISLPTDRYFNIVRMPFYFFLSGFFFKTYSGFTYFLRRKTDRLLIPFIFFYLTTSVILPMIAARYMGILFSTGSEWTNIYAFLTYNSYPNYPLWFLWALMIVNVIFYLIVMLCKQSPKATMGIICLLCTVLLGRFSELHLPASLNEAIDGLWFFFLGYFLTPLILPRSKDKCQRYSSLLTLSLEKVGIVVLFIFIFLGSISSGHLCLLMLQRYVGGACGILSLIYICKKIGYLPYVSYVGRFSIIILVTHEPMIRLLSMSHLSMYICFPLLLASYLVIIPLMTRYMPYVTAQKEIFSR